jgi:hypothetical protein
LKILSKLLKVCLFSLSLPLQYLLTRSSFLGGTFFGGG